MLTFMLLFRQHVCKNEREGDIDINFPIDADSNRTPFLVKKYWWIWFTDFCNVFLQKTVQLGPIGSDRWVGEETASSIGRHWGDWIIMNVMVWLIAWSVDVQRWRRTCARSVSSASGSQLLSRSGPLPSVSSVSSTSSTFSTAPSR